MTTGTYPLVAAALSRIEVKNKGTLESNELASMKATKTDTPASRTAMRASASGGKQTLGCVTLQASLTTRVRLETAALGMPRLELC